MNLQTNSKSKGFTIIEVVLVLAIAGLIFLMVFIALPALQRNQRDTQRRDSLASFSSQLTQYQTNNKGTLPGTQAEITAFVSSYMTGDNWKDPLSGNAYPQKSPWGAVVGTDTAGTWYYQRSAQCSGETISAITPAQPRRFAVQMRLEGSGIACQDNSSN